MKSDCTGFALLLNYVYNHTRLKGGKSIMKSRCLSLLYTAAVFAAAAAVSLGSAAAVKAASSYDVVIGNYTWSEALQGCKSRGGHLATIDSETEFYAITGMLQSRSDWSGKVFYIGGKRDPGGKDYYWVDGDGNPYGTSLLSAESWASRYWGPGEPTYEYGGVQEYVCSIFKYQGAWILNDEPDDMVAQAPDYYGITGYLCEYDDPAGDPMYVGNPSFAGTGNQASSGPGAPYADGAQYAEGGPYAEGGQYAESGQYAEGGPYTDSGTSGAAPAAGATSAGLSGAYAGAFEDAMYRHNTCGAQEPYNGIVYTVLDIDGDGNRELIFSQLTNKHSRLFWVYRITGDSWEYMGEVGHDSDENSLRGYRNGLLYREFYKGSIRLYQALWNGSSFETTELYSGEYDRNGYPPSMEQLAEWGCYNASEVTDVTPGFRDLSDLSLLQ